MRNPKRLPILWKFFKSKRNFKLYLRDIVQLEYKEEFELYMDVFYTRFNEMKVFHKVNPDLRFSQIIQTFVLYKSGFWFYLEDEMMLIKLGLEPREILYWGNNFNKENKRLKRTKWILIKDMNIEHIQKILKGHFTSNLLYIKAFETELKLRKNESTTV